MQFELFQFVTNTWNIWNLNTSVWLIFLRIENCYLRSGSSTADTGKEHAQAAKTMMACKINVHKIQQDPTTLWRAKKLSISRSMFLLDVWRSKLQSIWKSPFSLPLSQRSWNENLNQLSWISQKATVCGIHFQIISDPFPYHRWFTVPIRFSSHRCRMVPRDSILGNQIHIDIGIVGVKVRHIQFRHYNKSLVTSPVQWNEVEWCCTSGYLSVCPW